ncbi:unnamed protein product [Urochloa humidicola]
MTSPATSRRRGRREHDADRELNLDPKPARVISLQQHVLDLLEPHDPSYDPEDDFDLDYARVVFNDKYNYSN